MRRSAGRIGAALAAMGALAASHVQAQTAETVVQPAADGVFAAFETHRLVGLADNHGLIENLEFYAALVRDPRFAREVGNVVVEFGASDRQDVIDRYVAGETVPYEELRSVWSDTVGWIPNAGSVGFAKFFAAVRETNATLLPGEQIRVWLGEPPFDWETATYDTRLQAMPARDAYPAALIAENILDAGEKALVIYGGGHFVSPFDDREISLLAHVEADYPGAFYVVLPYSSGYDPEACLPFVARAGSIDGPALAAPAQGGGAPEAALKECATDAADDIPPGTPMPPFLPVIEGAAVLIHGPLDTLTYGMPGLADLWLDPDYRAETMRRVATGPSRQGYSFPDWLELHKSAFDFELHAPGYAELLDAMFAAYDANGDGVVNAAEYRAKSAE